MITPAMQALIARVLNSRRPEADFGVYERDRDDELVLADAAEEVGLQGLAYVLREDGWSPEVIEMRRRYLSTLEMMLDERRTGMALEAEHRERKRREFAEQQAWKAVPGVYLETNFAREPLSRMPYRAAVPPPVVMPPPTLETATGESLENIAALYGLSRRAILGVPVVTVAHGYAGSTPVETLIPERPEADDELRARLAEIFRR